jgi:hypothetical protein
MRILKKSGLLAMLIGLTVLLSVLPAHQALGWGAVTGTSEVHQLILNTAYEFLQRDNAVTYANFPTIDEILANEGVTSKIFKTGPGPDGAESNSPWSEHWYNADSPGNNKGRPPASVARDITALAQAILAGNDGPNSAGATPGHSAAWAAHFLADVETPYHTNGTSLEQIQAIYTQQGGENADEIILAPNIFGSLDFSYSALYPTRDFKAEIERFLATHEADPMADWFDPWYFNSYTDVSSSHVLWEGFAGNITEIPPVNSFDSAWKNPAPSFTSYIENLSTQAAAYTKMAAENSRVNQMEGYNNPAECVHRAAQRVATLWRASISGCNAVITVAVPDKKYPEKLKVTATIKSYGYGNCSRVQAKLSLTGGTVLDSPIKDVADFGAGTSSAPVSWNINVTNLNGARLNVETIYSCTEPDLQYTSTNFNTGKITTTTETTKTTETTELKTTSVVILFNGSSQMGKIGNDVAMPMIVNAIDKLPASVVEVACFFYGGGGGYPVCTVYSKTPFKTKSEMKALMMAALNYKTESQGQAPLAKGITESGAYLNSDGKGKNKVIVLMSNSAQDTCGGDPIQAAKNLPGTKVYKTSSWLVESAYAADGDESVSLQIIGVKVGTPTEETGLKQLAAAGGGQYFSADDVDQMAGAIEKAIKAGESSSGSSFKVQPWWFIVGGFVVILIIFISVLGRRRARPAVQAVGVPTGAAGGPYTTPGAPVYAPALLCPKCGAQNKNGAAFCVRCGSSLAYSPPAAMAGATPQTGVLCANCGTRNSAGSAFCKRCGSSLALSASRVAVNGIAPQVGIFCGDCGTRNAPGSAFCNKCGSSLASAAPRIPNAAAQTRVFCPACGTDNAAGNAFCKQCGTPIRPGG